MSRYRWVILAVSVGSQSSFAMVLIGVPVLGPVLRGAYGVSLTAVGVAIASVNAGMVVTLLGWGHLADRRGDRLVISSGLCGAALFLSFGAVTPNFALLLGALVGAGACGASVHAASSRAVAAWFPAHERGTALGIRQTAVPLGGALIAVILPLVVTAAGFRGGLVALSVACLVGGILALLWLREAPDAQAAQTASMVTGHPLSDRRVWWVAVGSGLALAAQTAVIGFSVLLLHQDRGIAVNAASAVLAAVEIGGALLLIVAGRWSDARGTRVMPLRRLTLAVALTLGAVAVLIPGPVSVLVLMLIVAGALSLSWLGIAAAVTAELVGPDRSGAALGFLQAMFALSASVIPIGVAGIADAASWQMGFVFAAACALGGSLMFWLVPEPVSGQTA